MHEYKNRTEITKHVSIFHVTNMSQRLLVAKEFKIHSFSKYWLNIFVG